MASLEGKLAQFGDSVVFNEAHDYFRALNEKLKASIAQELVLKPSYLSKFEVVDDLRKTLREDFRTAAPPTVETFDAVLSPLLDPERGMLDVAKDADYEKLETYLNDCATKAKGAFDPPLAEAFQSAATGGPASVYNIPNTTELDPRRHGRIIMIQEYDGAVQKWLQNNALLYGLTLYGSVGLYYIGFKQIKDEAISTSAIVSIVNRFQRNAIPASAIQIKASTIQAAKDPVSLGLDAVRLSSPVKDNDGNQYTVLYRVNKQTGTKEAVQAYSKMYMAAKAAGITLTCNSGFRPAAGQSMSWTSDSGVTGRFTTQESLRRDSGRWVKSHSDYKSIVGPPVGERSKPAGAAGKFGKLSGEEAFIFYARSGAFTAPTAPPGRSNHGAGFALDFNTGSRVFFGKKLNDAVYKWLAFNAHKYGFVRTVSSEEWHFEYRPNLAVKGPYARVKPGSNGKLVNNGWYVDLGLNNIPAAGGNSGIQGSTSGGGVTPSSGGGGKAVLMTGLTTDVSHQAQINYFKEGFKGNVSAFTKGNIDGAKAAVQANGGGPVVLFSAGALQTKKMATAMESYGFSRDSLYVVEPYNSGASGGTANAVKSAVNDFGLPAGNVILGPSAGRGSGILSQFGIQGGTNTPSGKNHFQALAWLGSQL